MFGEILEQHVREVRLHIAIPVRLARHEHEVEALVGLDERVGHADGVSGMHVVIHVARDEEQVALEVGSELDVRGHMDLVLERVVHD